MDNTRGVIDVAKSKFTVSVSLTIIHPEGVRLTKKAVSRRIRWILEEDDPQPDDFGITRAVVRDVDFD